MKYIILSCLFLVSSCTILQRIDKSQVDPIPYKIDSNRSATYDEVVSYYQSLDKASRYLKVNEVGMTDIGEPLLEVIIDKDRKFSPSDSEIAGKAILFINNGIHPGEPCGIDASMILAREILEDKILFEYLDNVVVVIVPVYNVGGAKNRNAFSRVNQNGPSEYGFRGNAKNLDLNRDFIKCDSKNAETFTKLFTKWNPDVFIDTHTSNGADYQHIITLIATQKDKIAPSLGSYMEFEFVPKIYDGMTEQGYNMSPYVYSKGATPDDKGIIAFPDFPRYSSGFAALNHTLSFMPETQMLKSFEERVESTSYLLKEMLRLTSLESETIQEKRLEAILYYKRLKQAPINWTLDEDIVISTLFKGYESSYKPSEVSGQQRLFYDRDRPTNIEIDYYNTYEVSESVSVPSAYIVPQAYTEVIERLKWNGVEMEQLKTDKEIEVEMYYIEDYETSKSPYEGHYPHYDTEVYKVTRAQRFYKGDYIIKMDQVANRFILETLEPQAPDSYFSWNFFDGILNQKEHFSTYVFEDLAAELLKSDPQFKEAFEQRKLEDEEFGRNAMKQLRFIYESSPHYEDTHMLYPVGRFMK